MNKHGNHCLIPLCILSPFQLNFQYFNEIQDWFVGVVDPGENRGPSTIQAIGRTVRNRFRSCSTPTFRKTLLMKSPLMIFPSPIAKFEEKYSKPSGRRPVIDTQALRSPIHLGFSFSLIHTTTSESLLDWWATSLRRCICQIRKLLYLGNA